MTDDLERLADAENDEFGDSGLFVPRTKPGDPIRLRLNLSTEELRRLAASHALPEVREMAQELLRERGLG